jgi:hypothetical protein
LVRAFTDFLGLPASNVTSHTFRRESLFLGFAAACFVFHHVPSFAGDWPDLLTPFAVITPVILLLAAFGTPPAALVLGVVGGVLYIDGHGIHLAANSIGHEQLAGEAEDVTHFWDETFGHIEWHTGWIVLVVALALAESRAATAAGRPSRLLLGAAALLLGFTLFTATVEGGTWWLVLAGACVLIVWTVRRPRPLVVASATAFSLAAILILVWAIWHGGVPEFSDVGWL